MHSATLFIRQVYPSFQSLMRFISKNKTLPNALEQLKTTHQDKINNIALAIQTETFDWASLIHENDAQLWVFHFMSIGILNEESALTLLTAIAAIKTVNGTYPYGALRTIVRNDGSEATSTFQCAYINLLSDGLKKFGLTLDQRVANEILTKQRSSPDDWLLVIRSPSPYTNDRIPRCRKAPDALEAHILSLNPLLCSTPHGYVIPSVTIMRELLQAMNHGAHLNVEIRPYLGRISINSLQILHNENIHPASILSDYVRSNYDTIEEFPASWLNGLVHDYFHYFVANIFTKNEFNFIFKALIPAIQQYTMTHLSNDHATNPTEAEIRGKLTRFVIPKLSDLDSTFHILDSTEKDRSAFIYYYCRYALELVGFARFPAHESRWNAICSHFYTYLKETSVSENWANQYGITFESIFDRSTHCGHTDTLLLTQHQLANDTRERHAMQTTRTVSL